MFINDVPKEDQDKIMAAAAYSAIISLDLYGLERGPVILLCGKSLDHLIIATSVANGTNDDDRLRMIQALRDVVRHLEQQEPDRN